jgi:CheY-like chemotaxis protein
MQQTGKIAIVVDDMFFAAKIRAAAEAAARQVERVKSREQLEQDLVNDPPALMIVDLNSERLDPIEVIGFIKSRPALSQVPVVAFVSHVQVDLIRRAEQQGCDYVLPRSKFTQALTEIVSGDLSSLAPKTASR